MWKQIGIGVDLRGLEAQSFLALLGRTLDPSVDVFMLGSVGDYGDDITFLEIFTCGSGNNPNGYCDPRYDRLIERAHATPDDADRHRIYAQAEAMLTGPNGALPIIPTYWASFPTMRKPGHRGLAIESARPVRLHQGVGRGGLVLAPVAQRARGLADRDHRHEDETRDEHAEDHVPSLFGGVGEQPGDHGASLPNRDTCVTRARVDRRLIGIAAEPAHSVDPGLPVTLRLLRAEMCAGRDQLGERRHRVEVAGGGDPDEAVRVEVVAEQERNVSLRRREEARPSVVDEIALVDRLEPEREALRRKRPEDALALRLGAQLLAPERALGRRLGGERVEERQSPKKSPTASAVRSMSSSECASETNRHSNCDGAM